MSCEEANTISIIEFLNSLGLQPVKIKDHSYWYLSPLRKEKTPSFKVDVKLNRWYDHGDSQGGKLIDLGTRLLKVDVSELLRKLSRNDLKAFSFQKPEIIEAANLEISKIKALENKALISYLEERSVPVSFAKEYCHEVHYQVKDKNYFAVGFKNDDNGFEIRNRYFKGCLGTKDITTILNPTASRLMLFEGFIDFLSGWKQLRPKMSQSSFLILNSVNQIEKAKIKLNEIKPVHIEAFFDNDDAGRTCFASLRKDFSNAMDRSTLYKGHKDINEMICHKRNIALGISM